MEGRDTTPHILNTSTRWRWVVSFHPSHNVLWKKRPWYSAK